MKTWSRTYYEHHCLQLVHYSLSFKNHRNSQVPPQIYRLEHSALLKSFRYSAFNTDDSSLILGSIFDTTTLELFFIYLVSDSSVNLHNLV